MMEPKPVDLYEFLVESELQHYYNSIKNELKITTVIHLKYASDEDLKQVGLSRPEIRRMRKFYEKYYPHGYLSKIKRLLQNPRRDDFGFPCSTVGPDPVANGKNGGGGGAGANGTTAGSPGKVPSNKHIIPVDSICVNKQLGTGEFGIVQQGVWTNGTERIQVAIKCLCRERMQSNPMDFVKEAGIMHSIEHENIVRLYGVVLDTDSLMLVTELAPLRSLLECLKDSGLRVSFLTVPTLCEFALQICNGMMYLENKRLIHRDLAARNILVFSKNKVKISDFGLSRALGAGKDYYQTNFNVNLKLPIAWCAPECINFLRFTNASDVWAYGVCLWEIFSYGFQPWAALTGHQILEAIDEPNYQRLEQPECCPREYYALMQKCWQHDPNKRQKFNEIYIILPEMKPEQLKTVIGNSESKKDHLMYRQGEIITVLDKSTNSPFWKGVLNSGKTGLFNPANTVAYLSSLPSSGNRDSFVRTLDRSSKRKLRTEMISRPQNDLKHTGHVGLDGAYFGDVAFLSSSQSPNYNHLPKQIVTPYKPSEDIEQTPLLLPPTPTSPDSMQTASGYFSESITSSTNNLFPDVNGETNTNLLSSSAVATGSSTSNAATATAAATAHSMQRNRNDNLNAAFEFTNLSSIPPTFNESNPFAHPETNHHNSLGAGAFCNPSEMDGLNLFHKFQDIKWPDSSLEAPHEYHEISDDEMPADKVFDMGPSLLDEMDFMFRSMSAHSAHNMPAVPQSPDFEHTNKKNELTELSSKLQSQRKNSSSAGSSVNGTASSTASSSSKATKKKSGHSGNGTVKAISVKDEKILNHAIEIANEISARSMTDLVSDSTPVTQSPKRKFSFRFPNLTSSSHGSSEKDPSTSGSGTTSNSGTLTNPKERKNFSEELKNVPDLQNSITEEHRHAYNSLVQKSSDGVTALAKDTNTNGAKVLTATTAAAGKTMSMTLPRKLSTTDELESNCKSDMVFATVSLNATTSNGCNSGMASRQMTLPLRRSQNGRSEMATADSNPLRILRDKSFPMVRPRLKNLPLDEQGVAESSDRDSTCESPSYLASPEYTFGERDINLESGSQHQKDVATTKEIQESLNPIPLPPRDRNKVMQTNAKRHVRKHPLIIPGTGLQRTLNKVTQVTTPTDDEDVGHTRLPTLAMLTAGNNKHDDNYNTLQATKHSHDISSKMQEIDHCYVNQDMNVTTSKNYTKHFIENNFMAGDGQVAVPVPMQVQMQDRTYENLSIFQNQLCDTADTASLHFESILEDEDNHVGEMGSPDVVDGFLYFDQLQKELNGRAGLDGAIEEDPEIRNLDIEKKKLEFSQKYPKYQQPKNELADNRLFNKVKELVATTATVVDNAADRADSAEDSVDGVVSAADPGTSVASTTIPPSDSRILAVDKSPTESTSSERKPTGGGGRDLGVGSDEVRIMTKVLGKDAVAEECLQALELIHWDVHKAIKIIKVRRLVVNGSIDRQQCMSALQENEWDLQRAAVQLMKKT